MTTLLYGITDEDGKHIGSMYITGCPDIKFAERLDYYGEEGYKFLEIAQSIFEKLAKIELLVTQEKHVKFIENDKTVIIPWNLVWKNDN